MGRCPLVTVGYDADQLYQTHSLSHRPLVTVYQEDLLRPAFQVLQNTLHVVGFIKRDHQDSDWGRSRFPIWLVPCKDCHARNWQPATCGSAPSRQHGCTAIGIALNVSDRESYFIEHVNKRLHVTAKCMHLNSELPGHP